MMKDECTRPITERSGHTLDGDVHARSVGGRAGGKHFTDARRGEVPENCLSSAKRASGDPADVS
jgi:hypothetical protein